MILYSGGLGGGEYQSELHKEQRRRSIILLPPPSLMVSAPFSPHLYSPWLAAGLTSDEVVPDFSAMYSGTPDR